MVQTHVAALAGDESRAADRGLSDRGPGEAVLFLGEPVVPSAGDLDWNEERLVGFGIKVTLGDDLRKPACRGFRKSLSKGCHR